MRHFQRRRGSNPVASQYMAQSTGKKFMRPTGLITVRSSNVFGHFDSRSIPESADEIVSKLEVKIRTVMDQQPDCDLDVVELVRRDTDSKYSKQDVKRITRKLIKKIAENAVVGKIVDKAIESLDERSEAENATGESQPEGETKATGGVPKEITSSKTNELWSLEFPENSSKARTAATIRSCARSWATI